jgi:hypothetical protein
MATPMRMLSRMMTYAEFLEWARQFAVEPFDDRRCYDQPSAMLQQMYVNSRRPENHKPYPLIDFMLYVEREPIQKESIDSQILKLL